MKKQITWKKNGKDYIGEAPVGVGAGKYHLEFSGTIDENGPYFNITKKYNNADHYYSYDIDGAAAGDYRNRYTLKQAQARCAKDHEIALDKNQLEWFFAAGSERSDLEFFSDGELIKYSDNPHDRSEYLIFSYVHNPADKDKDIAGKKCYVLVKHAKSNEVIDLARGCLGIVSCEEKAQEDLRISEKSLERQ